MKKIEENLNDAKTEDLKFVSTLLNNFICTQKMEGVPITPEFLAIIKFREQVSEELERRRLEERRRIPLEEMERLLKEYLQK